MDNSLGYLSPVEWRELQVLMQQARYRHLPPSQESRLRQLLAKRDGKATQLPWEELVSLGLVALGAYFLVKALK